jgi:hypothetical protein
VAIIIKADYDTPKNRAIPALADPWNEPGIEYEEVYATYLDGSVRHITGLEEVRQFGRELSAQIDVKPVNIDLYLAYPDHHYAGSIELPEGWYKPDTTPKTL